MAGSSIFGNDRGPGNRVIDGPRKEGKPRVPDRHELWQPVQLNDRLNVLCKERGWNRMALTGGQRVELLAIIDGEPVPERPEPKRPQAEVPREWLSPKSGGTSGKQGLPGGTAR